VDVGDPIRVLLEDKVDVVLFRADAGGKGVPGAPFVGAIIPGSFNPLHEGHEKLAAIAAKVLGMEVAFEISVVNADKPPIEETAVRRRVGQFVNKHNVLITRAPLFIDKARLFPSCTFVIGWDTFVRIVDPKYYGNDESLMRDALSLMRSLHCRFLVAGRIDPKDGNFHSLDSHNIPLGFEDMFIPVPEELFRLDISSTELRARGVAI